MDGIVQRQIDGVVAGTEYWAAELDMVRGLQKRKDRDTAARCFLRGEVSYCAFSLSMIGEIH
jgi:hypothetical protein